MLQFILAIKRKTFVFKFLFRNHHFSVELCYGNIYCHLCHDFVYDPDFEYLNEKLWNRQHVSLGLGNKFTPWRATPEEVALLRRHRKRKGFSTGSTIGLRGED